MKWLEAFNTDGESTSLAQMNAGTTAVAGNFNPPVDSVIRKVAVFLGGEVATSLVEDVRIELESSDWTPNRLHFLASGNGIRTAPATHIPAARRSPPESALCLASTKRGHSSGANRR